MLVLSDTWRKKKIEKIASLSYEDRAKIIKEIEEARNQQQQQQQNMEKAKIIASLKDENLSGRGNTNPDIVKQ